MPKQRVSPPILKRDGEKDRGARNARGDGKVSIMNVIVPKRG